MIDEFRLESTAERNIYSRDMVTIREFSVYTGKCGYWDGESFLYT